MSLDNLSIRYTFHSFVKMRDYLTTLASKPEREGKEHWCLVCLFSYCLQGMERNSLPM